MLRDLHRGRRLTMAPARPTGNAGRKGSRGTGVANRPIGGRPLRPSCDPTWRRSEGAPDGLRRRPQTASVLASAPFSVRRPDGARCATLCAVSKHHRSTPEPTPPPDRAPLPEDPWSLPEPGPEWSAELERGLAALALEPSPGVRRALDAHSRLLLAWTAAINLTAVRDPAGVARLHLVDSLSAVSLVRREAPAGPAILDIGSGGGFPGLPLGLAAGASRLELVDSIGKKVRFQAVAARACAAALTEAGEAPPAIEARLARVEDLARLKAFRGAFDVVTARAVSSLTELVELGLPLLRTGGLLVAWKRDDGTGTLDMETSDAARIGRVTGAGRMRVLDDPEPAIPGHRLVVVRKERDTPDRYPRIPAERKRLPDG